nr:putative protein TPRXL [Rhipicephalus microplus]
MLRPNFRDAAGQTARFVPPMQADNHQAAATSTGTPFNPQATTSGLNNHPSEPLTLDGNYQTCVRNAGSLVSTASQRALPTSPQPSIDRDRATPATTPPTSDPVARKSKSAPEHDDQVDDAPTSTGFSTERGVPLEPANAGLSLVPATCTSSSTPDNSGRSVFTTATSPHALEPAATTDIVVPAIRPPIAEASPSTVSEDDSQPALTRRTSCKQPLSPTSTSPAAEVPARDMLRPNFRDAAGQTARFVPPMQADNHQAAATSTGTPFNPQATTSGLNNHPSEPLTLDGNYQTCVRNAGSLAVQSAGLTIEPEKCQFGFEKLRFLGHVISAQGVGPDPEKTVAVGLFSKELGM